MSLVNFKPTNHPQQVGKRGASDTVDERITPDWLFAEYDARFKFTVDVAANATNTKVSNFYDLRKDGLILPWRGHSVWCNPPYSNIAEWVKKAHEEFNTSDGMRWKTEIVMLLPANRTEQKWWQTYIEPFRDRGGWLKTEFLPRRINFGVPGNENGKWFSSSPFGLVVVIFQ